MTIILSTSFFFFFFFLVKDDFIEQLNKNNKTGAHPIKIYTIRVFLKNIANVHRWTNKGNKITFLINFLYFFYDYEY